MPAAILHPLARHCLTIGTTRAALARRVGVTPGVLALVDAGRVQPWPALRRRLAAELGIDFFPNDRKAAS